MSGSIDDDGMVAYLMEATFYMWRQSKRASESECAMHPQAAVAKTRDLDRDSPELGVDDHGNLQASA